MITNLSKLDADVQKFRDEQLDEFLDEPDNVTCSVCHNFIYKDDCYKIEGEWVCAKCREHCREGEE